MNKDKMKKPKICVLGAGIVGLTTALEIQLMIPDCELTIIADKFNMDTTSDGAAGLFAPVCTFRGPTKEITREWIQYSYQYYKKLLHSNCGVSDVCGYILSDTTKEAAQDEMLCSVVHCYRPATEAELAQVSGNWKYGTYLCSLIIRGRKYLPWLLNNIQRNGCKIINKTVRSFAELEGKYNVVVNCTGLRSATLCNDNRVVPIRGQILKVRAPNINRFYLCGDTYIIPHEYGIVSLGGTVQYNVSDTNVRQDDTDSIRSRCARLFPELKEAVVAWEWVGLRPFRDVIRVEAETKGKLKLVHNYGHGGSGLTSAPATARDAVKLVQQQLLTSNL